jgi:hypothetical protein
LRDTCFSEENALSVALSVIREGNDRAVVETRVDIAAV